LNKAPAHHANDGMVGKMCPNPFDLLQMPPMEGIIFTNDTNRFHDFLSLSLICFPTCCIFGDFGVQ